MKLIFEDTVPNKTFSADEASQIARKLVPLIQDYIDKNYSDYKWGDYRLAYSVWEMPEYVNDIHCYCVVVSTIRGNNHITIPEIKNIIKNSGLIDINDMIIKNRKVRWDNWLYFCIPFDTSKE